MVESVYSAGRTVSLTECFIAVVESVYSAVRTDSLYKADFVWSLNKRGGNCLQRGMD